MVEVSNPWNNRHNITYNAMMGRATFSIKALVGLCSGYAPSLLAHTIATIISLKES